MPQVASQIVTAVAGAAVGALLAWLLARAADKRRLDAEDKRRWLADRRSVYASYLGLAGAMLQEIDSFAIFLSGEGSEEQEEWIKEGLLDYLYKWETELQRALGEVQLLASPDVVDLAERVSGALMDITAPVELRQAFDDYYPGWFQTQDLVSVLLNAMRGELGLLPAALGPSRRDENWPWLDNRPARESYVQSHPSRSDDGDSQESSASWAARREVGGDSRGPA